MATRDSVARSKVVSPGRLMANYWVFDRPSAALDLLESSIRANPSQRFSPQTAELFAQFNASDSARAILSELGPQDKTAYFRGTDTLATSAWFDLSAGRAADAAMKFRGSMMFAGGTAPSQTSRDAEIGLAFESAALRDSAISAYEHYLNGPPRLDVDASHLVWVLEHVARLYEAKGQSKKARAAYTRIVDLWKDADPELQARVTFAREHAAAAR